MRFSSRGPIHIVLTNQPPFNCPSQGSHLPPGFSHSLAEHNALMKKRKRKNNKGREPRSTFDTGPVRIPLFSVDTRSARPPRAYKPKGTMPNVTELSDESRSHHCGAHGGYGTTICPARALCSVRRRSPSGG
jgi:hypothetical protein